MVSRGRAVFTALFVFILAFGMIAPAIGAVTDDLKTGDHDDENLAPNPYIDVDTLTVAEHPMAEGASDDAMAGYEDDSAVWVANPVFSVNTTKDIANGVNVNPYSFRPGHIEDESYTAFSQNNDTWANASKWFVNSGSGNVTISNSTVAANVEGVHFDGTGIDSAVTNDGNLIYEARFDAWSGELDSDESKRFLQFAVDVDTLDTNAEVQVRIYDESADYKEFTINDSETFGASQQTVLGNGTNDYVKQVKLSRVSTTGGGSWDNIENVTIRVVASGGGNVDTDFTVSWLDLRKKGPNTLGEQRATTDDDGNDPDSDGEYDEFQTVQNATNTISVHSMGTLDAEYDDAVIHDVQFPARFEARLLKTEGTTADYRFSFGSASDFPGFDHVLNVSYRLELPTAIDLSYSGLELVMTQKWPDGRYQTLGVNEGLGGTNLTAATYTDETGSLAAKGDVVSLDTTVSTGTEYGVQVELTITDSERDSLEVTAPAGGTGPTGGSGGIGAIIMNPITWILTALGGVIQWLRGAWPFSGG